MKYHSKRLRREVFQKEFGFYYFALKGRLLPGRPRSGPVGPENGSKRDIKRRFATGLNPR